jgi:xylan 1,4-beta-xylosidase
MTTPYLSLPVSSITVDAHQGQGALEYWRHTVGHGGINVLPLPDHVADGIGKLKPRLLRTFIQEYFNIYPEQERFDWSKLDPYMESLARTGADIVAAICIKPKPLFPVVDATVWQPTDVVEWQYVIAQLVQRYSVDRRIVTYWEIGNETDIGENGGSPYLIPDPESYVQFYEMTIAPILQTFPQAKVGGPAACWIDNEPLPGLVEHCRRSGTQLDFISWHLYSNDPRKHAVGVERAKKLLEGYPGKRPEMLVTEWSKGFEGIGDFYDTRTQHMGRAVSVAEMAFESRRAAITAASILAFIDAGLDWSFYYHIWDQVFYADAFRPFFSDYGLDLMIEHWNEMPHRFGLFGVDGLARPQYFVYILLEMLGDERLACTVDDPDLHAISGRAGSTVSVFVANFNRQTSHDRVATIHFEHITPGPQSLTVYRIDNQCRWSQTTLELEPLEQRPIDSLGNFRCQVHLPADSVALVRLEEDR